MNLNKFDHVKPLLFQASFIKIIYCRNLHSSDNVDNIVFGGYALNHTDPKVGTHPRFLFQLASTSFISVPILYAR